MILVTVGTDQPFDRLVAAVDRWAAKNGRQDVFAQIGHTDQRPQHIASTPFIEPADFHRRFTGASVIVAHAGMGTILSALRYGKPIVVMPRRASLGEQRNEHQLATARHLQALGKIHVALDENELLACLDSLAELKPLASVGPHAEPRLLAALRTFIHAPGR